MKAFFFSLKIITRQRKEHMNRQESATLNMDKFIRTQTLLLLEKIDQLDLDDGATECEKLHEQAEKLYQKLLA
ncbi:Rop family plasmid primer RNA-binding protein, partial [Salmonella enterica]|uniref:Rop family plasmid primer RNA-binding protein n=1 Tax=Salmonella enterica TaxID=28901 RepID=UPI0037433CF8